MKIMPALMVSLTLSLGLVCGCGKKEKPQPELCEMCLKVSPDHLANISGEYLFDKDDYWYLCVSCHVFFDQQMFMNRLDSC